MWMAYYTFHIHTPYLFAVYMTTLRMLETRLFCRLDLPISFLFKFEISFPNIIYLLFKVARQT